MTGGNVSIRAPFLARVGPAIDAGNVDAADLCDDLMAPTLPDDGFCNVRHVAQIAFGAILCQ